MKDPSDGTPAFPPREPRQLARPKPFNGVTGFALVVVSYAFAGMVGAWLTLPPGVAAPVWPGAGIALVAALLGGPEMLPAVWLGSFAANCFALGPGFEQHLLAVAIAAGGAAMQAGVGALLARRAVSDATALLTPRDVIGFVVLVGPVACVVSALVGPIAYIKLGVVPGPAGFFEVFSWYIGDLIGVVGVAPLMLSFWAQPATIWRVRVWRVGVPMLLAVVVTVVGFQQSRTRLLEAAESDFAMLSASRVGALKAGLSQTLESVDAVAGLFEASERVEAEEFATFVRRSLLRSPFESVAWVEVNAERGARVTYVEPVAARPGLLGTDPMSEPITADLLTRAAFAGSAASAPIGLRNRGDGHDGLAYAVAINEDGRHVGYALAILDVTETLNAVVDELPPGNTLRVRDVTGGQSAEVYARPDAQPSVTYTTTVDVGGRVWEVEIGADAVSISRDARDQLSRTYAGGAAFVVCAACFLLALSGRTAQLEVESDQRRQAEERLKQAASELRRSNHDLEQFAYVASHDLRAPLRAIRGLASWIAVDAGARMGPESLEHLSLLQSRAARLDAMVEGLLHYARAGRMRQPPEPVDVRAVALEAAELAGADPRFRLVVGDLPRVVGRRAALLQVFTNLIGNSVRHHDQPTGTISVTGVVAGDLAVFRVEDDGPGIEPRHRLEVFDLFKTLRSRDEVEGSGLGLSIVKRLVEAEGGSVTIESAGERGAAVVFTWPLVAVEHHDDPESVHQAGGRR